MEDFLDGIFGFAIFVVLFFIYSKINDCMRDSEIKKLKKNHEEYENLKKNVTNEDINKISSVVNLPKHMEEDLRESASQNEWGQTFISVAHELAEKQKEEEERERLEEIRLKEEEEEMKRIEEQCRKEAEERKRLEELRKTRERELAAVEMEEVRKRIDVDFNMAESEMAKMSMNFERHFDGYNDLGVIMLPFMFALEPVRKEKLHIDYMGLRKLKNDYATSVSMPHFCGEGSEEYIYEYLINTCLSTEMGIAFAYSIRTCTSPSLIKEANGFYGLIKITTPSHNRVTNNFDGWLVDFVTLPEKRKRGLMKLALNFVLDKVEDLGVNKIYAMVMPDNKASLHVLQHNGFKYAGFGGVDRATGKHSMLLVHEFETTD